MLKKNNLRKSYDFQLSVSRNTENNKKANIRNEAAEQK